MSKEKNRINLHRLTTWILITLLVLSNGLPANITWGQEKIQQHSDIQGHWAEDKIADWIDQKLISGYGEGIFKPNNSITRAEFMTIANKVFGFTKLSQDEFSDVASSAWFHDEVAKAKEAGYINGYVNGTMRPTDPISRQEAAAIISKLMSLDETENETIQLSDLNAFPQWSKGAIVAAVSNGYMGGYTDGSYKHLKNITRAETVVILSKAVGSLFKTAGTYGTNEIQTIKGNVTINTAGVNLKNYIIEGNLYLTAGIDEGNVGLDNVTVRGKTLVSGGGEHSVIFKNSNLGEVITDRKDGKVRIVAEGTTSIRIIRVGSSAKLETQNLAPNNKGFVTVFITSDEEVELSGSFENVVVKGKDTNINILNGSIENITIDASAKGSNINILADAKIKELVVNGSSNITGTGEITKAEINVDDVSIEQIPTTIEVDKNVIANVGGEAVIGSGQSNVNSGGNNNGGGNNAGGVGGGVTPVMPVTLSSIAITTPATKLAYKVGDSLSIAGLVITGTYSNNTTKVELITTANVSGFNSAAPTASQTLTITLGGKTTSYNISIAAAPVTLSSIAITSPATKLAYTVGDTLNISGLVVTGTYSNNTTKVETITTANVSGFNSAAPAPSQTLTITFGGKTATYEICIGPVPITLSSISITSPATKLAYIVGDALDLSGLVVTATCSDDSKEIVKITAANISGFNSTAPAASQTLTITFGGKTTSYIISITAAPVMLSSIAITSPATKLAYTVGEQLSISGLVVTGTYSNNTTKVETITTANISGFNSTAPAASQTLTITFGGKTTTYTISIAAAPVTLSSIAVTTPATKLAYLVGDPLNIDGLVVTGFYSDNTTKVETITTTNISGFNSTAPAASQTLTITLGGKTTTYNISIVSVPDVEITSFVAIANVNAGTAGFATYANAGAVQAILPMTVSANAGAVSVPVTAWVDTDSYNPALAGSYTFTATLGAIPAGYVNTGNYTATVEVVVSAPPVITGTLSLVGDVLGVKSYQIQITGAAPEDVTLVKVNNVTKTFQIIGGVVRFNSTVPVTSVQFIALGQTINVPTGIITATATLVGEALGIKAYGIQVNGALPTEVTEVLVNNVSTHFEVIAGLVRVNSGTTVTSIKIVALGQTIVVVLP